MTGENFEEVLDAYFQGWRDGYAQAINDFEHVLDDQGNGESNHQADKHFGSTPPHIDYPRRGMTPGVTTMKTHAHNTDREERRAILEQRRSAVAALAAQLRALHRGREARRTQH
jgi:hypothetical protein